MSINKSKAPNSIFRRKSDGKIVVQKDGKILATYDDAHRLVEMHIKGLKAKEKEHKKSLFDYKGDEA